jgi:hypothetical protein
LLIVFHASAGTGDAGGEFAEGIFIRGGGSWRLGASFEFAEQAEEDAFDAGVLAEEEVLLVGVFKQAEEFDE